MVRLSVVTGARSEINDSEYKGLLHRMGPSKEGNSTNGTKQQQQFVNGSTVAPIDLDHLTQQKQSMISPGRAGGGGGKQTSSTYNYYGRKMAFTEYCSSYISVMCHFYPKCCGCFIISILLTMMISLANFIWNPTEVYGDIHHDHSNIKSKYDLSMGSIDHWCLGGGDDRCGCEDPLIPLNRVEYRSWGEAFKANRKVLKKFQDPMQSPTVDVAFLGESIGE